MKSEVNQLAAGPIVRTTRPRAELTDRKASLAKPDVRPYKLADGNGLYLLVNPNGSKLWRLKYRVDGKEKLMTLGAYPATSLALARKNRDAAREKLARAIDPMADRRAEKQARRAAAENSFQAVAKDWWDNWRAARTPQHADQVWRRFEANVFPRIGSRPVAEIQAPELVAMAKGIEGRGVNDLAKRALQTSGQVFRYAIAHGLATRNPAADIKPSDILASAQKKNMARIEGRQLPELMRKIEGYQGTPITRFSMKLMAMTFVRTRELIAARWEEVDLDAARWDIPAERMKMKTPHIVPLSTQAVEVLRTLHLITGHGALLFPGERDHEKPMSNNTILKALERMGYKGTMTGHGFRGLASTLLHEMGFDHAHIELQLAHQERNKVSASYNHATYLHQRKEMMQSWSDYLATCTTGRVLQFNRKAG